MSGYESRRGRARRRRHNPPQDAVAAIATELQELATRAQSLLSKLAESGLLTTEEVTAQKRRFLG